MSPVKALSGLALKDWSTISLGYRKGWVQREDIFDYAISQLESGSDSQDVAIVAGGGNLSDEELLGLVEKQAVQKSNDSNIDKWRLAFLLSLDSADDSDEEKVNRLQEIYAEFGYPEDMASCSIYSQDGVPPLVAMRRVINELQSSFLMKGGRFICRASK